MEFSDSIWEFFIKKPVRHLFKSERELNNICKLLRELVCDHQGTIIEHVYWGAELHKKLRLAHDEGNQGKIKSTLHKIDNDLPTIFMDVWLRTVSTMNRYFRLFHKSTTLPRMCIKAVKTMSKEQYLVDVFREDGGTSDIKCKVFENSGIYAVQNNGRFFICNDIPQEALIGDYTNPRLNGESVKQYKAPNFFKTHILKKKIDDSWLKCWVDYRPEVKNDASCYKSTLIVPMTLVNNPSSSQFLQQTMIGLSKHDRFIYGFLCFDHMEKGYFSDNDINVGYIVADLLSFYMINELNFTKFSETYKKAKAQVANEK